MKAFKIAAIACALATGASSVALAQSAPIVVGEAPAANILPEGTEVQLRTLTELSSKTSKVGDRFNLEVVEDVRLNNQVVIPAGSRAAGEVTKVTKKGMFGKSGKLETRLLYVRVGDQQVAYNRRGGRRGKGGTAATVASLALIWPAAFFVTGTSAMLALVPERSARLKPMSRSPSRPRGRAPSSYQPRQPSNGRCQPTIIEAGRRKRRPLNRPRARNSRSARR